MRIQKATKKYEAWLAKSITIVPADLALKHTRMAADPFQFLRATFYRWMQVWPLICPDLARAPRVLAVGDLHVENFGTWRDKEARLIWGVNDFDEAYPMPYTVDLVRLAVSAHLAINANHLTLAHEEACAAILAGYREGLEAGGKPFVLEENNKWLREAATGELRDPIHFWGKMSALPSVRGEVPKSARKALEDLMPAPGLVYRVAHRVAGLGSLGRERYVALADWDGGRVAREAKALVPSACFWAKEEKGSRKIFYEEIITSLPIAHALKWPRSPRNVMRNACSTPWASKPPTSIWEAKRQSRMCAATSPSISPDGFMRRPKRCWTRSEKIGKNGVRDN